MLMPPSQKDETIVDVPDETPTLPPVEDEAPTLPPLENDPISEPENEPTESAAGVFAGITLIPLDRLPNNLLLTKVELASVLGCSPRTLGRMVRKFELPPPITLAGRSVWISDKVKEWVVTSASRRESEAAKEAVRLKVFLR